jgi:hypothetical protein
MVFLVDALGSGSSGGFPVEVRVFSSAPSYLKACNLNRLQAFFYSIEIPKQTIVIHLPIPSLLF